MIPKLIHYHWFGNKRMSNLDKRCISSWIAYLPGYKLKLWNESNAPLKSRYAQKALQEKKWSIFSNYIRLYALYHEGGIFLNTNVEVIRTLDPLLNDNLFLGFQTVENNRKWINNAVLGSVPGHPFIKECMVVTENALVLDHYYYHTSEMTTTLLKKKGLRYYGEQKIDDINLYPVDYFFPYKSNEKFDPSCITDNTYCIHHWESTWLPPLETSRGLINRFVKGIKSKMHQFT